MPAFIERDTKFYPLQIIIKITLVCHGVKRDPRPLRQRYPSDNSMEEPAVIGSSQTRRLRRQRRDSIIVFDDRAPTEIEKQPPTDRRVWHWHRVAEAGAGRNDDG